MVAVGNAVQIGGKTGDLKGRDPVESVCKARVSRSKNRGILNVHAFLVLNRLDADFGLDDPTPPWTSAGDAPPRARIQILIHLSRSVS